MISEMLVGDRRVTVCGSEVSIFVEILLVELTNTVFVNSTDNISTNIETPVLSKRVTIWRPDIFRFIG